MKSENRITEQMFSSFCMEYGLPTISTQVIPKIRVVQKIRISL